MPNKLVYMERDINYSQQPQLKGSIVKEYMLVVNPQDDVWQQVMNEKTVFSAAYGQKGAEKTKPHITVASFLAKEEMEETLLRWMHRIVSRFSAFTVALNNYSGFPNSGAIYLRVQDHQPFRRLAKELRVIDELVRSNGLPQAQLVTNPHMTIARRLDTTVYEKAMAEYARKDFHAEFNVSELVLLKRVHQFDKCSQVSVLGLQP